MSADYRVQAHDCAGLFDETTATDFEHALSVLRIVCETYPAKHVALVNVDRVDIDCSDGLTEDERDRAGDVAWLAKSAAMVKAQAQR